MGGASATTTAPALTCLSVSHLPPLLPAADSKQQPPASAASSASALLLLQAVVLDRTALHTALNRRRPPQPCACYTPQQIAALAAAEHTDSDNEEEEEEKDRAKAKASAAPARPMGVRMIGVPTGSDSEGDN
jgi:hypothetical protein